MCEYYYRNNQYMKEVQVNEKTMILQFKEKG